MQIFAPDHSSGLDGPSWLWTGSWFGPTTWRRVGRRDAGPGTDGCERECDLRGQGHTLGGRVVDLMRVGSRLIGGSVPFPASAQQSEQGAQARAVQADLQALGHNPGGVDGRWGRQSVQALLRFQRAEGLPLTGRADLPTVTRLRERRQAATGVAPYARRNSTVNAPSPVRQSPCFRRRLFRCRGGNEARPIVGGGPGEAVSSTRPEGGRVASSDEPLPSPPGIVPPGIPANGEVLTLDRPHHAPTAVVTDTRKPAFWNFGRLHVAPAIVAAAVAVVALWALRRRSRPGTHLPATSAGISDDAPRASPMSRSLPS